MAGEARQYSEYMFNHPAHAFSTIPIVRFTTDECTTTRSRPRPNGATQTFRRPSQINTSAQSKENPQQAAATPTSGVYVPPHLNSNYQPSYGRPPASGDFRYSKEQMLDIFKSQEEGNVHNGYLQSALTEGWTPGNPAGNARVDWARRDEVRDSQNNPDICWNFDGVIQPLALIEMSEDEKEVGG